MYTSGCLNTWCSDNQSMKYCAVLGAQGIRATGFKGAQGNAHCTKFESNTNRMTFEYAPNKEQVPAKFCLGIQFEQ